MGAAWRRVAAVEERMEHDAIAGQASLLAGLEQCADVRIRAVHAAVRHEADEVERGPFLRACSIAPVIAALRKNPPSRTSLSMRVISW